MSTGIATNGPSMQLYNDGIEQGSTVTAEYIGYKKLERPLTPAFDGTWVIVCFAIHRVNVEMNSGRKSAADRCCLDTGWRCWLRPPRHQQSHRRQVAPRG